MSSSTSWKTLDVRHDDIPTLLFRCNVHGSGYRIELTDLCRIWAEELSRGEIIERASDAGSCIDPSEDDEQFKILLGKIESALNGDNRTAVRLHPGNDDGNMLLVEVLAPLPHPLPDFTWTIKLQRQPEPQVESELVTPLLLQASRLQNQVKSLIDELHDKDRVISKICDRLETSGNDLTTVFPGVSNIKTSRKRSQREQLAKHVKGLEDFDEINWESQVSKAVDGSEPRYDALQHLPDVSRSAQPLGRDNWWSSLTETTSAVLNEHHDGSSVVLQPHISNGEISQGAESVEEEFQRQGTPPHFKSVAHEAIEDNEQTNEFEAGGEASHAATSQPTQQDDDETTEDEDDLDAPLKHPKASQTLPDAPRAQQTESDTSSPSKRKLGMIGSRSSHASESPAREASSPPHARPKLGTIGSKSKGSVVEHDEGSSVSTGQPSRRPKVGTIGGKKQNEDISLQRPNESVPAREVIKEPTQPIITSSPPQKTPEVQETEEERADKKRDQLKRELEEKAKVPVKKKRKF